MKKMMILSLVAVTLAMPLQSNAWVSYGRTTYGYGHVSYGHVTYGHVGYAGGWSCGGVSTGTAVAAGVAGLATGAMIGAAVAKPAPVVVAPAPIVVAPAPYVVAPPPVVVAPVAPVGSIYYSLPGGVQSATINGTQYYVYGSTYYRPYFGNNGVYYQVVPSPL